LFIDAEVREPADAEDLPAEEFRRPRTWPSTVVTSLTHVDIEQMRDQVFFDGPERNRRLSRYWLLLLCLGALLLFATNVVAILASGIVVMALYRVGPVPGQAAAGGAVDHTVNMAHTTFPVSVVA